MDGRRILREERGAVLVEFAFSSIILLTTLFGIIGFGLAIFQYNIVSNLAQEGARWASVRGGSVSTPATNGDVQTYVQSRALGMTPTVTTTWPDGGSNLAPSRVQVVVVQSFTPFTLLVPNATLQLRSTAQMIIAR